jgi:hypothetical protein
MMLLQENSNFRKVSLGMKKRISEKLKVKDLEKKVQNDLFPEAKARLEAKVSALPISDKMKEYLASKIRSMQYVGGDCMQAERGYSKISIDFDLVNSAAYMEGRNDFFICNGLALAGQSDFNLLFTIAHELAHGLGPCGVQYAVSEEKIKYDQKNLDTAESQYMFSSLLKCLRNKDSIAAKRDEGMFSAAWRRIFGTSDRMFCSGDQIGESIADWFATEVMADHISKNYPNMKPDDALKAISNILKPLCSTSPGPELQKEFESHPQWKDRINRIILAQPKIRQTLGCSQVQAPAGYCDGSSSQPVKSISGRISPGSSGGATR